MSQTLSATMAISSLARIKSACCAVPPVLQAKQLHQGTTAYMEAKL
jgi:hypothetical protein